MKTYKVKLVILLYLIGGNVFSQNDTLIVANNYKLKVGVKGLLEKSKASFIPGVKPVYNFGVQGIYKIGRTKSSIETGAYHYIRSFDSEYKDTNTSFQILNEIVYKNIHIPINYRLDTRVVYFSLGVYVDYIYSLTTDNFSEYIKKGYENNFFSMGYDISIGIEKNISSLFSFFVEAESSVDITSIHNKGEIKLLNYGFAIGINYKILKK